MESPEGPDGTTDTPADEGSTPTGTTDTPAEDDSSAGRRPWRRAGFAVARTVVVLGAAGLVYPFVIPVTHPARGHLAGLVPTSTGLPAFDKTTPQAGEQGDTQKGLPASLTSAAKKDPARTGLYSIEWSPNQTSGAGVIAFLLPDAGTAATTLTQIRSEQLGPSSYSADSLKRTATFTVAGLPGSAGALFQPTSKGSLPSLAVVTFRYNRVAAVSEVAVSGNPSRADAESLARREYRLLVGRGGSVTLTVVSYPVLATALWGAGAAILALIVGVGPVLVVRRRERRRRQWEAEMANRVLVGQRVIAKRRR